MNREIEFRGFDGTQWYYGDLEYNRKTDGARIHTYKEDGSYDSQYAIDPDTVGQFTGQYDKNDKKIYEGDIVRWDKDQKMYVVEFRSGMFYASIEPCNPHIYGGFPLWFLCEEEQHCEIICNIYDNPELLSAKQA